MRSILTLYIIFALYGCTQVVSQEPSEDAKREAEFIELMKKAKQAQETNKLSLQLADQKTNEIITEAKEQIVTLKEEVVELKETINEITNPDTADLNIGFKLLPISSNKENR